METAISLPRVSGDVFVHVPHLLDVPHLESVLASHLAADVKIKRCTATSLCGGQWRVSNSGSTVLRLSLVLTDGRCLDLVAKILSPDPLNIFKIDVCFSSRIEEVAWAQWWAKQGLSCVPITYDTRADTAAREFWIIHEYFPRVGWDGLDGKVIKRTSSDASNLNELMRQIALLHAHSRLKIDELRAMFPSDAAADWGSCSTCCLTTLRSRLVRACRDGEFLSSVGVSDQERESLRIIEEALEHVPTWVEQWDEVCVTSDWAPDNFGFRSDRDTEPITFDWGTAHLGPMEEDMAIVLVRLAGLDKEDRRSLLTYYLDAYGQMSGNRIRIDDFLPRIPWAEFLRHVRLVLEGIEALRWIPHQTRSREAIHFFVPLCIRLLERCRSA